VLSTPWTRWWDHIIHEGKTAVKYDGVPRLDTHTLKDGSSAPWIPEFLFQGKPHTPEMIAAEIKKGIYGWSAATPANKRVKSVARRNLRKTRGNNQI